MSAPTTPRSDAPVSTTVSKVIKYVDHNSILDSMFPVENAIAPIPNGIKRTTVTVTARALAKALNHPKEGEYPNSDLFGQYISFADSIGVMHDNNVQKMCMKVKGKAEGVADPTVRIVLPVTVYNPKTDSIAPFGTLAYRFTDVIPSIRNDTELTDLVKFVGKGVEPIPPNFRRIDLKGNKATSKQSGKEKDTQIVNPTSVDTDNLKRFASVARVTTKRTPNPNPGALDEQGREKTMRDIMFLFQSLYVYGVEMSLKATKFERSGFAGARKLILNQIRAGTYPKDKLQEIVRELLPTERIPGTPISLMIRTPDGAGGEKIEFDPVQKEVGSERLDLGGNLLFIEKPDSKPLYIVKKSDIDIVDEKYDPPCMLINGELQGMRKLVKTLNADPKSKVTLSIRMPRFQKLICGVKPDGDLFSELKRISIEEANKLLPGSVVSYIVSVFFSPNTAKDITGRARLSIEDVIICGKSAVIYNDDGGAAKVVSVVHRNPDDDLRRQLQAAAENAALEEAFEASSSSSSASSSSSSSSAMLQSGPTKRNYETASFGDDYGYNATDEEQLANAEFQHETQRQRMM